MNDGINEPYKVMDKFTYLKKAKHFLLAKKWADRINNLWLIPATVLLCLIFLNPLSSKEALTFTLCYKPTVQTITIITLIVLLLGELILSLCYIKTNNKLNKVAVIKQYTNNKHLIASWLFGMKDYYSNDEPWFINDRRIIAQITFNENKTDEELLNYRRQFFNEFKHNMKKENNEVTIIEVNE